MNRIEKIFYEIGTNPVPFVCGWLSGLMGLIAFFVVKIITQF